MGSSLLISVQPREMPELLPFHSSLWLAARSPLDAGRRIFASTSGAVMKREFSRARGETVSCRQLRDARSEELMGARSRMMRGLGSESVERDA